MKAEESTSSKPGPAKLVPCDACKTEVSTKATECVKCGHPVAATLAARKARRAEVLANQEKRLAESRQSWEDMKKSPTKPIILGVLVVVMAWLSWWPYSDNKPVSALETAQDKQLRDEGMAWAGAQTVLKQTLRDPGSYEEIQHAVIPHKTKPDVLGVYLQYRAKNGFGGYEAADAAFLCVRGTYQCAFAGDD